MEPGEQRTLSGEWRAATADDELRRFATDATLDDTAWERVVVPGHWRSVPAFADSDGPLLYRHRFAIGRPPAGQRAWLTLEGVFHLGDVYLDGAYLGATEGYFVPHTFEVTDALAGGEEHVLAVEVASPPEADPAAKRHPIGAFWNGHGLDREWNAGGLWRPVHVGATGPVRIARLRVRCREANEERAVVALSALLDSDRAGPVTLRTTIAGVEDRAERTLAVGANQVEWTVRVDRPRLWWPHALGDQPLEDLLVEVLEEGGQSDHRAVRVGLREVALRRWVLHVNGERLFLKGASLGPTRLALGEATHEELARDVALAVDAGLDHVRVHAHVTRRELYDAADEAGLLVWQDLPLQGTYARSVRRAAVRQAEAAVDLLGHHPSVALWCGHDEPFRHGTPVSEPGRAGTRFLVDHQLPAWNKTVLDRSVKRALQAADGTRPVVAGSGLLPHVGAGGSDAHLWLGWHRGSERALGGTLAAWPRLARFVGGFGAQAVPDTDGFLGADGWPDLDWERLERHHGMQREVFERRLPPPAFDSFDGWRRASQAHQAEVIKHHVETLRRLKYRPTAGFTQFWLVDGHPAVSWSVLDHLRHPKEGHRALVEGCRPVIVLADAPPGELVAGTAVALDVHVVNDLRRALPDAVVTARLAWPGGVHTWRWEGEVPADACAHVGTVQFVAPGTRGELQLDLDLGAGDVGASNRYTAWLLGDGDRAG